MFTAIQMRDGPRVIHTPVTTTLTGTKDANTKDANLRREDVKSKKIHADQR